MTLSDNQKNLAWPPAELPAHLERSYFLEPGSDIWKEVPGGIEIYLNAFRSRFGENLFAVMLYGSTLSPLTARPDSFPDFFIILEDYSKVPGSAGRKLLLNILPPSVFSLKIPGDDKILQCKYNLISRAHLRRATGPNMRDVYIAGRLSKFLGIIYARDARAREEILSALCQAVSSLQWPALADLPLEFDNAEFALACLSVSYLGEVRPAEPEKIREILASRPDFYRRLYDIFLNNYIARGILLRRNERFAQNISKAERKKNRNRTRRLYRRSRRRGILRWPKHILTVGDWLELLHAKVERSAGEKIHLSPREKKWPLIFIWKHYFALKRRGKIK